MIHSKILPLALCLCLVTAAMGQEREIYRAMHLDEALTQFAFPSPALPNQSYQVFSDDLRWFAGVTPFAGSLAVGPLDGSSPPLTYAVPNGASAVGMIGSRAIFSQSSGNRLGGIAHNATVHDLVLPGATAVNTQVLRQGLQIHYENDQAVVVGWALAQRAGFDGTQHLLLTARFNTAGELLSQSELPLGQLPHRLQQDLLQLRWIDPTHGHLALDGYSAVLLRGPQGTFGLSQWPQHFLAVSALRDGSFLTLGPPQDPPAETRPYGITLLNGSIVGAFDSRGMAIIRRWKIGSDGQAGQEPSHNWHSAVPAWLAERDRSRRQKLIDCGDDILLLGASIAHQGVPNEILGFLDLQAETVAFTPLLVANNIITLSPKSAARAWRDADGGIRILLSLGDGRHLLLPWSAQKGLATSP